MCQARTRKAVGNLDEMSLLGICHLARALLEGPEGREDLPVSHNDTMSMSELHSPPRQQEEEEPADLASPILACLTARPQSSHARRQQQASSGTVTVQSAADILEQQYIRSLGLKLLLRRALSMLMGKDKEGRDAALRFLLPSCINAVMSLGGQQSELALSALWECCR